MELRANYCHFCLVHIWMTKFKSYETKKEIIRYSCSELTKWCEFHCFIWRTPFISIPFYQATGLHLLSFDRNPYGCVFGLRKKKNFAWEIITNKNLQHNSQTWIICFESFLFVPYIRSLQVVFYTFCRFCSVFYPDLQRTSDWFRCMLSSDPCGVVRYSR